MRRFLQESRRLRLLTFREEVGGRQEVVAVPFFIRLRSLLKKALSIQQIKYIQYVQ
jgi:hypothetical protein